MSLRMKKDDAKFQAIRAAFDSAGGTAAVFGSVAPKSSEVHYDNEGKPTDLNTATTLAVHEFGLAPHAPERSVIRAGVISSKAQLARTFKTGVLRMLAGQGDAVQTMEGVGKRAAEEFRRRIMSSIPPPLSARTMADPNRDPRGIPLLDTGQIMDSIGHRTET